MIEFVALSFTALCRELAHSRKAPVHLPFGLFVFNCHPDHVFGVPNMEADFGEDSPCSELVDMMSRHMILSEEDTLKYITEVQNYLIEADFDGRLYCMNGMNVANPREMKKILVLGGLAKFNSLPTTDSPDRLQSLNGLESWLEEGGVEVIR